MRIMIVGASGHVGGVAREALEQRHEIVALSRSSQPSVDLSDPGSVGAALEATGTVDAIVVCAGSVPFKPLSELGRGDYMAGLESKVLGQIEFVSRGLEHLADHGSITLTSGVLAREPIATGAAAALANGAVESFVMAAAAELPRGIRINAVSPTVLANSPHYHDAFPGFVPVSSKVVGAAYVRAVEGVDTGRVFAV